MITESQKKSENGLKLIAIKSLPGCDEKYLNILEPGTLYYFYPNPVFAGSPERDPALRYPGYTQVPIRANLPRRETSIKINSSAGLIINKNA